MSHEIKNMLKLKGQRNLVQCNNYTIKDVYDDDGMAVGFDILIQMEYYYSLTDEIRKNGTLPVSRVEKLAVDIAHGLKAMHDINMLHRDVKIGNIFFDNDGNFALGDFGVSKQEKKTAIRRWRVRSRSLHPKSGEYGIPKNATPRRRTFTLMA